MRSGGSSCATAGELELNSPFKLIEDRRVLQQSFVHRAKLFNIERRVIDPELLPGVWVLIEAEGLKAPDHDIIPKQAAVKYVQSIDIEQATGERSNSQCLSRPVRFK